MFELLPGLKADRWTSLANAQAVEVIHVSVEDIHYFGQPHVVDFGSLDSYSAGRSGLLINTDRFDSNELLRGLFLTSFDAPPTRLHVLHDVYVHTGCWLVAQADGAIVRETVPAWERGRLDAVMRQPYAAARSAKGLTREFTDPVCAFQSMVQWNYAHWHLESLAGMELAQASISGRMPFLVGPGMRTRGFHGASLAAFADQGVEMADVDGVVRCRRLVIPSRSIGSHDPCRHLLAAFARIVRHLGAPQAHRRPVYIARFDAPGRREMTNERELAARLETMGFTILETGRMSYRDQVFALGEASIVVGAHGAGLFNLGFAKPGVAVVEIHTTDFRPASLTHLAIARGDRAHLYLVEPSEGAGATSRFQLDIDDFVATLGRWGLP